MDSLISKTDTERIVDSSERVFSECFDMLSAFKSPNISISDALQRFQPALAEALYDLMTFYQKLKAERRYLISQKHNYSTTCFRSIMAENDSYTQTVQETIKIGKSLGDAFAWFFYQNNLPELLKHFEHPSTGLHVGGLGGKGELEFIKHNQVLSGLFVIYHGNTSMLRVGDFSLYAPKYGIVGLGELKTEPTENGIKVNAYISSRIDICTSDKGTKSQSIPIGKLTSMPTAFPTLKRQLAAQDDLLFHSQSTNNLQPAKYDYKLIEQLSIENPIVFNEDHSLMLTKLSCPEQSLFKIISTHQDIESMLPDNYATVTEKLVVPESAKNRFIVGLIDTEASYLRIPPFWWSIDNTLCKKIYFRQIYIATLFNPAHLIQHMEDNGFNITDDSINRREIDLIKTTEKRRFKLCDFNLFFDLVSYSLMVPKYILEIIDKVIADIEMDKYPPNTKIDMIVQQSIFPPSING